MPLPQRTIKGASSLEIVSARISSNWVCRPMDSATAPASASEASLWRFT